MRAIAISLTITVAVSAAGASDQASAQDRRTRFRVDTTIPDEDADAADATRRRGTPLHRGAHRLRQPDERLPAAGSGVRHDRRGQRGAAALLQRQSVHLRRSGNRRGRARSRLQRARLPRVSPKRRDRRREPDRRASHGPLGRRRLLRIARRLARPFAGDAPRHRRARALRGHDPHVPNLDEHARRGLHRGGPEQAAPADPRQSTGCDARHASCARPCSKPKPGRLASGGSAGRASTRA